MGLNGDGEDGILKWEEGERLSFCTRDFNENRNTEKVFVPQP